MGMNEGQVVKWLKAVGDPVLKGDPLVEIESTKVSAEVEATADGTLGRIIVEEGKTVPVGTILGLLLESGESPSDLPAEEAPRERAPRSSGPSRRAATARRGRGGPVVTPRARRLARELNVDLDAIETGTGPSGRVTEDDVRAAAEGGSSVLRCRHGAKSHRPAHRYPRCNRQADVRQRVGSVGNPQHHGRCH